MARIPPKTVSKADCRSARSDLETRPQARGVRPGQGDRGAARPRSSWRVPGLREPDKPIGCYLFTGPTGVGKTEVAKQLAASWASSCCASTCREYMERHTVSRLIGAPPGYVGFDQGGLLTDGVDQHPHCVLLLDEIEKAHPDLFNILLQVMDHGTLTDHERQEGRLPQRRSSS